MDPADQILSEVLDGMANAHGEQPAILFQEQELTYEAVRQEVDQLAGGLAALGLARTGMTLPR